MPSSTSSVCCKVSLWLVLVGVFFTPFSIALSNLVLVGAILALFVGSWSWRASLIVHYRFLNAFLLFLLISGLGLFFTPGSLASSFDAWGTKLYLFLVLIAIFPLFTQEKMRHMALNALVYGVGFVCLLLIIYGLFEPLSASTNIIWHHVRLYHWTSFLPLGTLSAFALFVILHKLWSPAKHKWLLVLAFLATAYVNFFFITKRTGTVIFILLLITFFWQKLARKQFWLGLLAIIVVGAVLFSVSSGLRNKFEEAFSSVQQYQLAEQGKLSRQQALRAYGSSVGQRLYVSELAVKLVAEKPWLGHGAGRVGSAYNQLHDPVFRSFNRLHMNDPDNMYIKMAVQWGVPGLLLYALFLVFVCYEARYLPPFERNLAVGLAVTYLVAGIVTSIFWKHMTALMLVVLLGVLFAASKKPKTLLP